LLPEAEGRKNAESWNVEKDWETGAHPKNSCAEPRVFASTELAAGKGQQLWITRNNALFVVQRQGKLRWLRNLLAYRVNHRVAKAEPN
jgi:hypothetical protein